MKLAKNLLLLDQRNLVIDLKTLVGNTLFVLTAGTFTLITSQEET